MRPLSGMLTEGQLPASLHGYTKTHKRPESNPKGTSPLLCGYKVKITCMTHTYPLKEIIEHYPKAVLTALCNPPLRMLEVKSWPQSSHSDF